MFNLKKLIACVVVIIIGVHTGNAALVAYGVNTFESVNTERSVTCHLGFAKSGGCSPTL